MSVTLLEVSKHLTAAPSSPLGLRQILSRETGSIRLSASKTSLTLLTQNMALLPDKWGVDYLGRNRDEAIKEIVSRIKEIKPDVVGLCEVFEDDEKTTIIAGVASTHPFFQSGPDETDLDYNGGLLLLSRHPIVESHDLIFDEDAGFDSETNKGVIHIRIQPPQLPTPCDIFYSHTQDIEGDDFLLIPIPFAPLIWPLGGGGDAPKALYAQLTQMGQMLTAFGNADYPAFIMGDLNIPGEAPEHYRELLGRLSNPIDLWTLPGNEPNSGFTFAADNTFYEDSDDNPGANQRLDYILMRAGRRCIPILNRIQVVKFERWGHPISDHFGLQVDFENVMSIETM